MIKILNKGRYDSKYRPPENIVRYLKILSATQTNKKKLFFWDKLKNNKKTISINLYSL